MSEPEPVPAESTASVTPWQRTARQLSRRTTDLLAIAIVAAGVLAISGRVGDWWSTDPSDVMSPQGAATDVAGTQLNWGSGDAAVSLVAGNFPVELERRIARGTQDEIDAFLLSRCERILATSSSAPVEIAEQLRATHEKLLRQLSRLQPLKSSSGEWNVYRVDQPGSYLPGSMLMGVRNAVDDKGVAVQSIACWAIAIPHNQDQWTTFVFTPTAGRASSSPVPLPVDAEPVLSLRTPGGDELSAFRSRQGVAVNAVVWRRTIEDALTQAGWQTVRPWRQSGAAWTIRVEGALKDDTVSGSHPAAIELSLRETRDGRLSGIVNVISKRVPSDEGRNVIEKAAIE